MHVFYLHGFASSPRSSKAVFIAERLAAIGVQMHCPDFNQPDFSTLTISRMLDELEHRISALPHEEVVLIGSSLGGLVAVEAAARHVGRGGHPVNHIVLLAPAVELEWDKWSELRAGGIAGWRAAGKIEVVHYAYDEPRWLQFGFYEDACHYRAYARTLAQPTLIFQGRHDESVSPAAVETFARAQPSAILHMLEDGHQLKNSLDFIWTEIARFLNLPRRSAGSR